MSTLVQMATGAQQASHTLGIASATKKNKALLAIAQALEKNIPAILAANAIDLEQGKAQGLATAMLDRLMLNAERIAAIAQAVRTLVALEDPIGKILDGRTSEEGLLIQKITVPLGVVGIIFEARPNVTVDGAALCLKSGNCCILRGGKEAIRTNTCLMKMMRQAVESCGIDPNVMNLVEDTTRQSALELMKLNGYLDVLIPRGGAGLIRTVVENSTVPVIETGVGNCHIYVDKGADLQMAANILNNAKTSRPSVCNAAETLLVHREEAATFLPMAKEVLDRSSVELRGCPQTIAILGESIKPATTEDYATEFVDYILAIKVVEDISEAMEHISCYGTKHSECIVTNSYSNANLFHRGVDAAAVYVNASTRFTDGGVFGLGAEIGISTQKLHARGPMGLRELTSIKYLVYGNGQIR